MATATAMLTLALYVKLFPFLQLALTKGCCTRAIATALARRTVMVTPFGFTYIVPYKFSQMW